jgi:serine protease AprX
MEIQPANGRAIRVAGLLALAMALGMALLGNSPQASAGLRAGLPASGPASKIELAVLQDTAGGKSAPFIVLMADQADVSAGYGMRDQDARGWYVYNTLTAHARRTQAGIRAALDAQGVSYQSFWAANMLVVNGDRPLVDALAARSDVGKIEADRPFKGVNGAVGATGGGNAPEAIEWGVQRVNAPAVWAMGYTGQGIVIGNQDTGMRWTHNSIKGKYRGWNGTTADHNYNWHDSIHSGGGSCGPNSSQPCDDYFHGTYTTGIAAGDDGAGNQIGVAPGAKWIGCRNMNVGTGSPASYSECFQFFIAPTDLAGGNPNPALRPHVMNNSWYCDAAEGCAPTTLETITENSQAAGIFVEASVGNSGPSCGTATLPAIYGAAFATGATDINNNLAGLSSRGPATLDGSNRLKPNISAPGISVRSAENSSDTGYTTADGTSAAGPHVVGVVALLWSAHPAMSRQITETKTLLQITANPGVIVNPVQTCGGIPSNVIPNNSFGYGYVDALAAVNAGGGSTPTPSRTATPSSSPVAATYTPTRTGTVQPSTPTVTNTPGGPTTTPTITGTPCAIDFTDVQPTDFFYEPVRYLWCASVISGYSTSPPCAAGGTPCFNPYANTTRGQMAKIVILGFQVPLSTNTTPMFSDVPNTNPFFVHIQTAAENDIVSGYADGTYRPFNNVTRGQLSKIVVVAASVQLGWVVINPPNPHFSDVPTTNPFYTYIETAACHGIISGYADGTFRWGNDATRGQIAKIVYNGVLDKGTCDVGTAPTVPASR